MIDSPIFGECEEPEAHTHRIILAMAERYPVHTFQAINQKLNTLGYCSLIDKLPAGETDND